MTRQRLIAVPLLTVIICMIGWFISVRFRTKSDGKENPLLEKPETAADRMKEVNERNDYLFHLLRDPKTNSIPKNIRARELEYARSIIEHSKGKNSLTFAASATGTAYNWAAAGPSDLGGRTRALAIDDQNSNTIIAGGVSGGIWKSTDNGTTWTLRNDPNQSLSVSYVVQDPRSSHSNVWYYSSGELNGNSASGIDHEAPYRGTGIYKSTDGGDTWQILPSTAVTDNSTFNSPYQYVSRIVVSPTTGSVFVSSADFGIIRSPDMGQTWTRTLGATNEHLYNTVAVGSNGILLAAMSQVGFVSSPTTKPGIYLSSDDGLTWKNITPSGFPVAYERTVISFAPSDPSIAYSYTMVKPGDSNTPDQVVFYKIKLNSAGTDTLYTQNRTQNMPDFGGQVGFIAQGDYNMLVSVSPADTNLVLLGSTNLYRSFDGFATAANNKKINWIGGYSPKNDITEYPGNHPDQHIIAWDPTTPDRVWDGHDGGLSYTLNITDTTNAVAWINKNNGYVVSQFYAVSLRNKAGDNSVLGGAQDNGSPYFQFGSAFTSSEDISSGDGGYSFLGDNNAYASVENGRVFRYDYLSNGSGINYTEEVTPNNASNQLFINPYAVDPDSQSVMYYPSGDSLWRNTDISGSNVQSNWKLVSGISAAPIGSIQSYLFSAIGVSHYPTNIMYLGASSNDQNNPKPILYKVTNSIDATTAQDISSPLFPSGAWLNDIAVNPSNANEILVVFSNYNVPSLFYSNDGGKTFSSVGGNLDNGTSGVAPSIRAAQIIPKTNGTYYLVGTSVGLYSTTTLDSTNTIWTQEASQLIGRSVVDWLSSRTVDQRVAVATHGRGVFIGDATGQVPPQPGQIPNTYKLYQNYPNPFTDQTIFKIDLPKPATVTLSIYNVNGQRVYKIWDDKHYAAGTYTYSFQPHMLASGIYLYHVNVKYDSGQNTVETKKFTYVK